MQGNIFGFASKQSTERKPSRISSTDGKTNTVQIKIDTTDEGRVVVCTRQCMICATSTAVLIGCGVSLGIWYLLIAEGVIAKQIRN